MQRTKPIEGDNNMSEVRLNKFLSDAGVCSRREADRAVEAGEVTVNVENAGEYASDVVIRVYRKKDGGYRLFEREPHPGDRLAGFTRVKQLQPGERRTLTIPCRY